MWLEPLSIVGPDTAISIPYLEGHFVLERIVKTSRVKQTGIHWKLPELKGRLANRTQRMGRGHGRLSSRAGAQGPRVRVLWLALGPPLDA